MTAGAVPALVGTGWLAGHLEDPSVLVAEIGTEPANPDYLNGHIPGAASWYWKDLFWDPLTREFASPQQVSERLAAQGVSEASTLVLYSSRVQFSSYGYWVLGRMCGHPGIRILDGGRGKWLAEGRPVSAAEEPAAGPAVCRLARAERDDSTRITRAEVLARLGDPGTVILDGRSAEEFAGLRVKPAPGFDHGAERAGHIPGAVHLPVSGLLGPDGGIRPAAELERVFRAAAAAPDQAAEVIAYCRLGHRASMIWFAMSHILGWDHVRVYDGSWTEWGSCVGMPVERAA